MSFLRAADLMEGAIGILQTEGWVQGVSWAPEGVSVLRAIGIAWERFYPDEQFCNELRHEAIDRVCDGALDVLVSEVRARGSLPAIPAAVIALWQAEVEAWNDAPGRTVDEVCDALRASAHRLRSMVVRVDVGAGA